MPDLPENLRRWEEEYDWSRAGEEWSDSWGGSELLWWGTLMPRLRAFLPTGRILEIGPGHGRWTAFLKDFCDELIAVDLSQRLVEACRNRFAGIGHLSFHANDGRSLPMVEDGSVDLAFSFDSLVHAEADVMEAYLRELAAKLRPHGVAFLHHSNMRRHRRSAAVARRVPERPRRRLVAAGVLPNTYAWRADSVDGPWLAEAAEGAGLRCISQERISWEYGRYLVDCISVLTPPGSHLQRPLTVTDNRAFTAEARRLATLRGLYWPPGTSARSGQPADPS